MEYWFASLDMRLLENRASIRIAQGPSLQNAFKLDPHLGPKFVWLYFSPYIHFATLFQSFLIPGGQS